MLKLTKKLQEQLLAYAEQQHPLEACGLLVQVGKSIKFMAGENQADNPKETFAIDPDTWVQAAEQGEVVAVFHSHPNGELYLSAPDRFYQVQTSLPWVLAVSGSLKVFECVARLRGRVFNYGVHDCAAIIKDAYALANVELTDCPRTDLDQDKQNNALMRQLQDTGFYRVDDIQTMQAGDVLLTSLGGNADHAALYLGNGEMLHHAYEMLSRREPYNAFWQRQLHSVWRHPTWQPEMIEAIENDMELS